MMRQSSLVHRLTVLAAGALCAVSLCAAPFSQAKAHAAEPFTSVQRCGRQVADTPKQILGANSYSLDTGSFTGAGNPPSSPSPVPVHKSYGSSMKTVWDAAMTNDTSYLGAPAVPLAADSGSAANPSRAIKIFASHNVDSGSAQQQSLTFTSADGGQSWQLPQIAEGDTPQMGVQLRDGRLLQLGFIADGGRSNAVITNSTGDIGTDTPVTVTIPGLTGAAPSPLKSWARLAGMPVQLNDGSVLAAFYGLDSTTATSHTIVAFAVAKPPTGTNPWTFQVMRPDTSSPLSASNPAVTLGGGITTMSLSEVGMVQRPDSSLIAVVRHALTGTRDVTEPMQYTRSVDGGKSWAALTDLQGTVSGFNGNGATQPGAATGRLHGINPRLSLLPNGIFVLTSGQPDNWIAYSTTGDATGWQGRYTYRNCPTTEVTPSAPAYPSGTDPNQWRYGSSGNSAQVVSGANQVLQFGDNCTNYYWGCVRTDANNQPQPQQSPYTVDLTSRIWQRRVSVIGPNTGKLDVAAMARSGAIKVTGDFTYQTAAHPRTGWQGAFDGSTTYWSSAVAVTDAATATMTLDLGRQYRLNRIGISLRPQIPASATVDMSPDGVTFTPFTSRSGLISHALSYTDQAAGVSARYVRITVPTSASCDAPITGRCAFLNEFELYSTVDGFENDAWGNLPRGADASRPAQGVWVTDDSSGGSHQALRLNDTSSTARAEVTFRAPPAATKSVTYRVKPVAWSSGPGGGLLLDLLSGTTVVNHLAVFRDGTVHASSDGSTWGPALGSFRVPLGSWSTITLDRKGSATTIRVGSGAPVAVPATAVVTSVDGYSFSSSGVAPVGDHVLIDDVEAS